MWYLNYCSPFIYESTGSTPTYRYILYSTLAVQFAFYVFFISKYKFFGQIIPIRTDINEGNKEQQDLHVKKESKSYPGALEREYRLDQKQFKEWYLHYFGLNVISVGGCIMYSPYVATVIFAVLQTILFIIACFMHSCNLQGALKYIYRTIMVGMVVLDIVLLFSITMGVGASGYDSAAKTCYLNL